MVKVKSNMIPNKKYNRIKLGLSKLLVLKKLLTIDREPVVCSINNAKTIGITFITSTQLQLDEQKKIVKQLSANGIKVYALSYTPEKKQYDFFLSEKTFNFFNDKELDWLLQPSNQAAIDFKNSQFDILIDFGSIQYYPMQLLVYQSKAKFKVGHFSENNPFDLMIDVKKSTDLAYYFDQVFHYLSKFNNN